MDNFRLLVEQIVFEQLIKEGKDPVELLHYKYKDVPSNIIDAVIAIDPTKKKSYSQWLLSHYDDEEEVIRRNLRNGRIEQLFQHYKNHTDIQIQNCPSVAEGLRKYVPEEDTVLKKSDKPTTYLENLEQEVDSNLANDFDIVFNQDDWIIAVPNTYEAECKLGENMCWCTANHFGNGRDYYNRYIREYGGKYFVNFDMSKGESSKGKDYPFTRYQFHFESRQFKDCNDDQVNAEEIDMPRSALKFYEDEGYDTKDMLSDEERWDRYQQQRYETEYYINDDLRLNIAYDENLEFEEPNENTDFYLFDTNDDVDPICWESVANPHVHNDVVVVNEDDICVLKKNYGLDDSFIVVLRSHQNRYRDWDAFSFNQYMRLPDDFGVFGIHNSKFCWVSFDGDDYEFRRPTVSSCEKMFVNTACTEADAKNGNQRLFIEAVSNGYHTLLCIGGGVCEDTIIVRDIPVNGEYFTINEKGIIEGEFRTYDVWEVDEDYNEQDWHLEKQLITGDYLIFADFSDEYNRWSTKYNIVRKGTRQLVIDEWFDALCLELNNVYLVKENRKLKYYSSDDGTKIGDDYDVYGVLDKMNKNYFIGIIGRADNPEKIDIINVNEKRVVMSCQGIVSPQSINNKVIIYTLDDKTTKVFDYAECKYYCENLSNFQRIFPYEHPYTFACKIDNTEEMGIFDLKTLNLLDRGMKKIKCVDRYAKDYLTLLKTNDKYNIFSITRNAELLPYDVDNIEGFNSELQMMAFKKDGRFYVFDYNKKRFLINPNGLNVKYCRINSTYDTYGGYLYIEPDNNYELYFSYQGNGQFKFAEWKGTPAEWIGTPNRQKWGYNLATAPEEVKAICQQIFGNQQTNVEQGNNLAERRDIVKSVIKKYIKENNKK